MLVKVVLVCFCFCMVFQKPFKGGLTAPSTWLNVTFNVGSAWLLSVLVSDTAFRRIQHTNKLLEEEVAKKVAEKHGHRWGADRVVLVEEELKGWKTTLTTQCKE